MYSFYEISLEKAALICCLFLLSAASSEDMMMCRQLGQQAGGCTFTCFALPTLITKRGNAETSELDILCIESNLNGLLLPPLNFNSPAWET